MPRVFTRPAASPPRNNANVLTHWGAGVRVWMSCLLSLGVMGAAHAGDAARMRHPIVLVHGFTGFENVLGVDYFFRIPEALRREGATVYIARVNPAQTTEFRGEELVQQLQQWAARDGVKKFNLLGHSHGGPTVRYAANVVPKMVASASSIAGAHQGTPVFDPGGPLNLPAGLSDALVSPAMKLLGQVTGTPSPDSASVAAAATSLSSEGAARFNARFPAGAPTTPCGQGPEVASVAGHPIRWYSYSGTRQITNPLDPSDALVQLLSLTMRGQDNDGAVPRCSSRWGRVIRDDYPWNHLDEINQVLGLIGPFAPHPVALYVAHANRLKLAGL